MDKLQRLWIFKAINGPAGLELGTAASSTPNRLGGVRFPLGIIAGSRSINWINSCFIPGPDDGKVSIERTKVQGMADHIVIPTAHPFLMKNGVAIQQTINFLRTGSFEKSGTNLDAAG